MRTVLVVGFVQSMLVTSKVSRVALLVSLKFASLASNHGLHVLQSPSDTRMCKTSVVFSLKEGPGELFKACSVFALRGLNMTNIESRPMRMGPSQASSSSSKNGGFRYVLCLQCLLCVPQLLAMEMKQFGLLRVVDFFCLPECSRKRKAILGLNVILSRASSAANLVYRLYAGTCSILTSLPAWLMQRDSMPCDICLSLQPSCECWAATPWTVAKTDVVLSVTVALMHCWFLVVMRILLVNCRRNT